MDHAACKDHPQPDAFFPSSPGVHGRRQAEEAALVCRRCPVQRECGEHQKSTGATAGVWGGRSTVMKNAGASSGGPQHSQLHGTEAGYRRHYRRGEKACTACRAAHSRTSAPQGNTKKKWT